MNRPPINAKRVMIAATVLLLLASQLPAWLAVKLSYLPHAFIEFIATPATFLHGFSTSIRSTDKRYTKFSEELSLEEQLSLALQKLDEAKVYNDYLEQDIARLRNVSDNLALISALVDTEDISFVGAKVIGFNGNRKNPILTINIGSNDFVRDGLAVVWGADLVGKVVSTSVSTADVQLITAADTKLQVRITRPVIDPTVVPVPAYIQLSDDGRTFYTDEFPLDSPVQVGDLALLADESWQFRARGFIVGTVTEVGPHPDRPLLNQRVVIRPNRPLASVYGVIVLVPVE
ncbi:MAG: rod shape-determining protein MreC [Phycisphaerales bacterium]